MKATLALTMLGLTLSVTTVASTVFAQENTTTVQTGAQGQVVVGGPATTTTQTTTVVAPKGTVVVVNAGDTDHSLVEHKFAVGFLGMSTVPIPGGGVKGGGGMTVEQVPAATIGARYWMNDKLGIDAGLGLGWTGGGSEVQVGAAPTVKTDVATTFAFRLHGGVPYAFSSGKHYTFMAIPELNIGYATRTVAGTPTLADTDQNGFQLDLGARIGTEIQFGFIGIPELSLQASVGLNFQYTRVKATTGGDYTRQSATALLTTVQAPPWAIFTNNISAFYYFP